MSQATQIIIFTFVAVALLVLSITAPWTLSDKNTFLEGFVNHEFLNFLGVVVTISLASAGNIHLEFNKIEEKAKQKFLSEPRKAIKTSAYCLILSLICGVVLVVVKPLVCEGEIAEAVFNSLCLLIVLFNAFILYDLTKLVFNIEAVPISKEKSDADAT